MKDLNSRIEAAKAEVSTLKSEIGKTLASKKDQTLSSVASSKGQLPAIRGVPSTKCRRTLKGHFGKVAAMHWSGDSKYLVSASQDGKLIRWNAVSTHKNGIINLKSAYVLTVGMEQSRGEIVACGGLDNLCSIYRFSQPDGVQMELASHEGFLSCCRFISQQQIVTASGDSTCILWDVSTGKTLQTLTEHSADVCHLSLSPENPNVILTGSVDKTVKLWDLRTTNPTESVQTFMGHEGDVNGVEFMTASPNTFGTASDDGTCRIFDLRAYNQVNQFGKLTNTSVSGFDNAVEGYTSASFSRSGRILFCGHSDGSVHAFDVLSDKSSPAFVLAGHASHVTDVGVSPKGDALCTASWDNTLKIWA